MGECCRGDATYLVRALYERCQALVNDDDAEQHFVTALEIHASAPTRPFEVARTHLCFGEHLRRRREARLHLADAWDTFSMLGARPWTRRAAKELEAAGVGTRGEAVRKSDLLTPQQYQVVAAVVAGATNREVADQLFISLKTVEFHLSAVYRLLGIRSRRELMTLEALAGR
jgi:DNA-binding CsgD family transcriptional regulator